MWTAIFPIWARIALIVGALATIFGIGYVHGRDNEAEKKDLEIATLQHAFDARVIAAAAAQAAQDKRAFDATVGAGTDQAAITAAYAKGKDDEAKASAVRVDALRAAVLAGTKRVRVDATCKPADAGVGGKLPGASATASGANGGPAPDVELSPAAVGRLSAAVDAAIIPLRQKIIALRAEVQSEHDRCNAGAPPQQPPPAAPSDAPPPDPVKSRSRFKIGTPNPSDK